jgi:hypothetical protein
MPNQEEWVFSLVDGKLELGRGQDGVQETLVFRKK